MAIDLDEAVTVPLRQADDFGLEPGPGPVLEESPEIPLLQTAIAAGLASAAAGWMVGGIFRGWEPRAIGLAAAITGAALGYAIYRFRRPVLQFVTPIAAVIIGAALVAPDAHTGSSNLIGLVVDAVRSGGFLQPPVDFAPGWKLILFVLFTMLGSGALGVAVGRSRPALAAVVPVPLALGAALVQPPGAALLSSALTIVGVLAAFAVAFGADLGRGMAAGSAAGSDFELRRLARTGVMVVGLVIAVVIVNQAGFLFPSPDQNRVVPPQRPPVPPAVPDVPLFDVRTNAQAPYRLGVIDVYDVKQGAWMLPEEDSRRLQRKAAPTTLPGPKISGSRSLTATFVVKQATGHLLPILGGSVEVQGLRGQEVEFDPRQDTISLADRPVFGGLTYTVVAAYPATGSELRAAAATPANIRNQFLVAPPMPLEVQALLSKAPAANLLDRLQYVRQQLYDKVVAAGPGVPTDVSAKRAVEILEGKDANPYEITATEALLARWAGIPARIGYGYYGGQRQADGSVEIRPRNGATWLEAYFGQYGWIPIVGTPPHAKPSSSTQNKNQNPAVQATDQLQLIVYLPVRVHSVLPIYLITRYWLLVSLPFVIAIVLLLLFYPGFVKLLRSRRRRRWGAERGLQGRLAVAYAEFRDAARDLAIGDPIATPLEFLDFVEPDKEHSELAWLVTRSLYGDFGSLGPTEEQAALAERFAHSVTRRLWRAQSLTTRILAFASRTSLRDPYSNEVPNGWRPPPITRAAHAAAAAAAVIALSAVASCGSSGAQTSRPLPTRVVPSQLGNLLFVEEPKAEAAYRKAKSDPDIMVATGKVFTIHNGPVTEGSVQVALFKPEYSGSDPDVAEGVRNSIGLFTKFLRPGLRLRAWVDTEPDQRIYLWFPPRSDSMALLILRQAFTVANADSVAVALIDYQTGGSSPQTFQILPDVQASPAAPPVGLPTFTASGQ